MTDIIGIDLTTVESNKILVSLLGRKGRARSNTDLLSQCQIVELERIYALREFDPQEIAALRSRDLGSFGKVLAYPGGD